jgi:DNA-binding NarL/FixJ family response regulator
MTSRTPRVIIVDDHLAARRGIELVLAEAGIAIAGVGTLDEVAGLLRRRHDAVLLEIDPVAGDAPAAARELLRARPDAPLVLICGHASPGPLLANAAALGAPGFVLASSAPEVVVDALHAVAGGGSYWDPHLDGLLTRAQRHPQRLLTAREREILGLLADGLSGPEIAARLVISVETVRTHIGNATTKLGARTRVQAVALTVRADGAAGPV